MEEFSRNREIYNGAETVGYYTSIDQLTIGESYLFGKYAPPGCAILDLGVGAGRTTSALAPVAQRYVGLDYAQCMVDACRSRFPELEFHCRNACDLSPLENESFDAVVFSFNGIDYIETYADRARCIAEINRVLVPGGYFIFSSHNARMTGLLSARTKVPGEPGSSERIARQAEVHPEQKSIAQRLKLPAIARRLAFATRMLTSPAFYLGHGYIMDPTHGGLRTFHSTPHRMAKELDAGGFELVETIGCHYPDRVSGFLVQWIYYVGRKTRTLQAGAHS